MEREWETEGEARDCEIVCMCVWLCVGVRVCECRVEGGTE